MVPKLHSLESCPVNPINPKLCQLSFKPKQSLGAHCAGCKNSIYIAPPHLCKKKWRKLGAHSFDGGRQGEEEEEERSSKPGGPRSVLTMHLYLAPSPLT